MARGFQPGNRAGTGQTQFDPRAPGGALSVTFDAKRMGARARRVAGMAARVDAPVLKVHRMLVKELQEYIAGELHNKVQEHGRAQRRKSGSARLEAAIRSSRARRVNVDGYTFGYLDSIAAIRPYWRGLELGSTRHVGRFLRGSFQNAAGQLVTPQAGGKDPRFLQFRNATFASLLEAQRAQAAAGKSSAGADRRVGPSADARAKGVRIKHPIVGYHYIATGTRAFIAAGFTRGSAGALYKSELTHAGLGELAATLTGKDVTASKSSKGLGGRPIGPPTPNPRAYADDPE